ncbi:IS3 family transposase [Lysinibacillus capsici]|uniref:IS3 family transposase n=1 Tax=Lysinibacillus capsici TaxID=2115968 RepID=UPI002E1C30BF|nr:IS3 family transposase [Lysinibacillus capsici]
MSLYLRIIDGVRNPNGFKAYRLEKRVGELCKVNKYPYGYRKITAILRKDRIVNHKAVQRIMQKYG